MNIAHVVFDLPLEGHFDYLIPSDLIPKIKIGVRVKVTLGTKPLIGFVVALAGEAMIDKIKPIKDIYDQSPIVNNADLVFAKAFSQYYGCSLGESLAVIVRHRRQPPTMQSEVTPGIINVHHCPDGQYLPIITSLIKQRKQWHILVPDGHVANSLNIPKDWRPFVGLRSSMFEAFLKSHLIIVIDDENPSFKQEQSPMYQVRDVLLMASGIYGFDVAFIGTSPSVELMHLVKEGKATYTYYTPEKVKKPSVIDLSNYKFLDKGILSPPARNCCQHNINTKKKTIILLNKRGSFSVTRCRDCGYMLKCQHCDSLMTYERLQHQYKCRHCSYAVAVPGVCPSCRKNNWLSFGMGVDQLQKELQQLFPVARIAAFDAKDAQWAQEADLVIATKAMLRFKNVLHVSNIICVDVDSELNRANLHSSFEGWSMMMHLRQMTDNLLIQTRNLDHFVFKALTSDDVNYFYHEELSLRKELGFSPFYHWVALKIRSKTEKIAHGFAQEVYNKLKSKQSDMITVSTPTADVPAKVRDQFRFKVMVGSKAVVHCISRIKEALGSLKRSRVIITIDIDP